jgi:hypothetical protein
VIRIDVHPVGENPTNTTRTLSTLVHIRLTYVSKWFYDTSTGAATGAARCGSFVGGAQIARGVGYPGIRWTRRFTWFGPPERNTLRPRVNGVVLLCLGARLRSSLFSLCQPMCVCGVRPLWLSSARTFYSPRPGSYREAPWPDRWPRGW